MTYLKYLKATGEVLGYGTDCWEDHPTEATVPLPDGFKLGYHTHFVDGELRTDEEQAKAYALISIRGERDRLLDRVDTVYCNAEKWESMATEKRKAWREYKQALRDLPSCCDPFSPIWPIMPE